MRKTSNEHLAFPFVRLCHLLTIIIRGNVKCSFNIYLNYDVSFKITNILKVNNDNLKFNSYFKSYITIGRILKKLIAFP
jgi:hypothetical protein